MIKIIIGTTPTITYKFKIVPPSDFRDCILTIKSNSQIILELLRKGIHQKDA